MAEEQQRSLKSASHFPRPAGRHNPHLEIPLPLPTEITRPNLFGCRGEVLVRHHWVPVEWIVPGIDGASGGDPGHSASLNTSGTISLMITASHNPIADNGVQISVPEGDMINQSWEPFADALANAPNPHHLLSMGELKKPVEEGKIKYIGLFEASDSTIRRVRAIHLITIVQIE